MQAKTVLVNAGTVLRCPRKVCGHQWMYRGNRPFYAVCPRCYNSVHIKNNQVVSTVAKEIWRKMENTMNT